MGASIDCRLSRISYNLHSCSKFDCVVKRPSNLPSEHENTETLCDRVGVWATRVQPSLTQCDNQMLCIGARRQCLNEILPSVFFRCWRQLPGHFPLDSHTNERTPSLCTVFVDCTLLLPTTRSSRLRPRPSPTVNEKLFAFSWCCESSRFQLSFSPAAVHLLLRVVLEDTEILASCLST
jgi:hypothetical protein